MRLCPFQDAVLQLKANSVHLSLIDDNFDHSCQEYKVSLTLTFCVICTFFPLQLINSLGVTLRHYKCPASHQISPGLALSDLIFAILVLQSNA